MNKVENDEIKTLLGNRWGWIGINDIRKEGTWTTLQYENVKYGPWLPGRHCCA